MRAEKQFDRHDIADQLEEKQKGRKQEVCEMVPVKSKAIKRNWNRATQWGSAEVSGQEDVCRWMRQREGKYQSAKPGAKQNMDT